MKPILALAAAVALATPAAAQLSAADCTEVARAAHGAMEIRQTGAPIHDVLGILAGDLSGNALALASGLIEIAYSQPLYGTDAYKAQAAAEFANDLYQVCRGAE